MKRPVLAVEGLSKQFPIRKGLLRLVVARARAVTDVALELYPGETLGIVGESGCGKSTLARLVARLIAPTAGSIAVGLPAGTLDPYRIGATRQVDIVRVPRRHLRPFRSMVQMVFQDPYHSLNPRLTVGSAINEVLRIHTGMPAARRRERTGELLADVGLRADMAGRYPHEFSGGQRQRASLARALAASPEILIADEAVSALDVSVQAQIIRLLVDLQKKYNLSIIFISHDLSVVRYVSDRVAVMYLGEIVEYGDTDEIFTAPRHPYTEALMKSAPRIGLPAEDIDPIIGEIPSNIAPPSGCAFHPRCPYRAPECESRRPSVADPRRRFARCHFEGQLALSGI